MRELLARTGALLVTSAGAKDLLVYSYFSGDFNHLLINQILHFMFNNFHVERLVAEESPTVAMPGGAAHGNASASTGRKSIAGVGGSGEQVFCEE